jgi:hypothetical protein
VKLLKDTEAEVRSAIAGQIPGEMVCFEYHSQTNHPRLLRLTRARNPSARGHAQHRRARVGSISTCASCSWHPDQRAGPDSRERRVGCSLTRDHVLY